MRTIKRCPPRGRILIPSKDDFEAALDETGIPISRLYKLCGEMRMRMFAKGIITISNDVWQKILSLSATNEGRSLLWDASITCDGDHAISDYLKGKQNEKYYIERAEKQKIYNRKWYLKSRANQHVQEPEKSEFVEKPAKFEPQVKRSGNGFSYDFEYNGAKHTAYGATEMEARKNAEILKKKIDGVISISISKKDALILYNRLFNDLQEPNIADSDTIKNFAIRLSTLML